MRVLVISGAFPPMQLAEANHTLHLCQNLAQHNLEICLLTTRGAVIDGLPFSVNPIMRDWSWAEVPRFVRFVRQCSPDAVLMIYIGFIYNDHPMATFAPTMCKFALPGIPFVTQFEGVMGAPPDRCSVATRVIRKLVTRWVHPEGVDYEFGTLLRDSDGVIVLAGRHESKLAMLHPPTARKCILIPPPPIIRMADGGNGVPRQSGRALLRVGPDEFVLVYYGYIYSNKGLETLLQAFQLLGNRGRRARLVIAGGVPAHLYEQRLSYVKELKELAAALRIQADIIWTGQTDWDREEASLYLHAADVCVLPFDEGVAMNNSTFAAAAAHGLPIISTRGKTLEQFFLHGENVFLCPPRDPEALAVAIQTVMDQPELRGRLASGASKLSREWFSWDRAVERTLATLQPRR
jgi:glycosyltransferase involved in cell wall biosynthesis